MKKCLMTLSLLGVILTAASCGPVDSNNAQSLPEALKKFSKDTKVDITFYHTMNQYLVSATAASIKEFNKEYPNITVNSVPAGGYDDVRDQMTKALSADGKPCDMVYVYPDHIALYNQSNSLVKLDAFIDSDIKDENGKLIYGLTEEQKNNYVTAFYDEGKIFGDGLMYSLPFSKSTELLYYNKTIFDENSLEVPTHWFSTNADDKSSMEYVCATLKKKYPTSTPLGYDSESNLFITFCEQLNSGYTSSNIDDRFLFNNDKNKEFVKKLKEWYTLGYFTTKGIYNAYTSNLFKETDTSKNRSFMCIGSSGGASNQIPPGSAFEVGVAPIPQHDVTNPKAISQGPSVSIFANNDKNKEIACWLLLKYLTTSESFQINFSMTSGYSPVIKSVYQVDTYKEWLDEQDVMQKSIIAAQKQENTFFTSPAFVGSSAARDAVGALINAVMTSTDTNVDKVIADEFEKAIKKASSK